KSPWRASTPSPGTDQSPCRPTLSFTQPPLRDGQSHMCMLRRSHTRPRSNSKLQEGSLSTRYIDRTPSGAGTDREDGRVPPPYLAHHPANQPRHLPLPCGIPVNDPPATTAAARDLGLVAG